MTALSYFKRIYNLEEDDLYRLFYVRYKELKDYLETRKLWEPEEGHEKFMENAIDDFMIDVNIEKRRRRSV